MKGYEKQIKTYEHIFKKLYGCQLNTLDKICLSNRLKTSHPEEVFDILSKEYNKLVESVSHSRAVKKLKSEGKTSDHPDYNNMLRIYSFLESEKIHDSIFESEND